MKKKKYQGLNQNLLFPTFLALLTTPSLNKQRLATSKSKLNLFREEELFMNIKVKYFLL